MPTMIFPQFGFLVLVGFTRVLRIKRYVTSYFIIFDFSLSFGWSGEDVGSAVSREGARIKNLSLRAVDQG